VPDLLVATGCAVTAYCDIDGNTILEATLVVPNVGPWYCTVVFESAPDVAGAVVLTIGSLRLEGVVDARNNGVFGEQRRARIVGGGGGWGALVPALHYHNDAGVRALSIAQDVARLAGEEIGTFNPAATQVGIDYVRQAGLASRVLEDVIGGVPWHVGFDGRTNVGERATSTPDVSAYEALEVDARQTLVTLAVDDLSLVGIGSILTRAPLTGPVTVHELEVAVEVDRVRVKAWGGATAAGGTATDGARTLSARGRIAQSLRDISRRSVDDRLWGRYRYRVVQMSGDRVELQAVLSASGLPDVLPVSMRPGVAGAFAKLTGGAIVLVEFVEGNRTLPIVSAFAAKGEGGHAPDELTFDVVSQLLLGGPGATQGVPLGTSLKSWLDAHTHTAGLLLDGMSSPVTGTTGAPVTASPSPSSKVKVAS
jgi:hypothetical protein